MYETLQATMNKYLGTVGAKLTNQFVRYFVVALVGLVCDFGTLVMLKDGLHAHYLLAAAAGFVMGLVVNYMLSTKYVFKDSKFDSKWLEFALFGVVGLVGLGILSVGMWFLVGVLGMWYVLAKCLATVAVYVWNFVGRKAMYRD